MSCPQMTEYRGGGGGGGDGGEHVPHLADHFRRFLRYGRETGRDTDSRLAIVSRGSLDNGMICFKWDVT